MYTRTRLFAALATVLLGVAFSGCDSQQTSATSPSAPGSLLGRWYLFAVDSTTVLDRTIPLTFGDSGGLYGSDGCNTVGGSWLATSTALRIPGLTRTAMECIDSRYPNLDTQVDSAVQSLRTWTVVAGELDLSDSTGTIRLRYKRTPSSSIDPGWFHSTLPCTLSVDPSATNRSVGQVGTDTAGLSLLPIQIVSATSTDSGSWLDVMLPNPNVLVRVFALDSVRHPPPVAAWDTVQTDTGAVVREVWMFSSMDLPEDLLVAGTQPSCVATTLQVPTSARIFVPWTAVQYYVRFIGAAGGDFTLLPPGELLN
ncbi:MAG TPA: META domain-containing protein [Fibrobacteria bacterium]|nr:META domain-containing protein [Fibrobacteria bacterium]